MSKADLHMFLGLTVFCGGVFLAWGVAWALIAAGAVFFANGVLMQFNRTKK